MARQTVENSIRMRMQRLRLRSKELCELADVDENTMSRVLNGRVDPRLSTITKIEDALDREEARVAADLANAGGDQ